MDPEELAMRLEVAIANLFQKILPQDYKFDQLILWSRYPCQIDLVFTLFITIQAHITIPVNVQYEHFVLS